MENENCPVDNSFGAIVTLARQITGYKGLFNLVCNNTDNDIQICAPSGKRISMLDIPDGAANIVSIDKHMIFCDSHVDNYVTYVNTNGCKVCVVAYSVAK